MSIINEEGVNIGKYCSECKFEYHQLACSNYPRCSHIKNRRDKNYSHREKEYERYPFGSQANPYGNCTLWEPRLNIARNIKVTVSKWWKEFSKGSWWE